MLVLTFYDHILLNQLITGRQKLVTAKFSNDKCVKTSKMELYINTYCATVYSSILFVMKQ